MRDSVVFYLRALRHLAIDEDGATAVEYGLIASLVCIGIIVSLHVMGTSLSTIFVKSASTITSGM